MSSELPASFESAKADFSSLRAEEFIPTALYPEPYESAKVDCKDFQAEELTSTTPYPAIILAAGLSIRMGVVKALLPLAGKPMICRIVDTCIESGSVAPITIVTGHEASSINETLSGYPVKCIFNPNYSTGEMLSSVQKGVRSLAEDCGAFFLILCDQPLVRATTLKAIAKCMSMTMAPVVQPMYHGKRGHPVLVSSFVIPDILALDEGETLKTALARYRDRSIEIAVADPGILFDIDTPEDYECVLADTGLEPRP